MATAEEGEGGEPPGLGRRQRRPRFRRSEVTRDMAGGGGGKDEGGSRERVRGPPFVYVLALPAMALPAVVSRLEATVPRRARSCLPRAVPSAWWSYRIPVLAPPPPPAEDPVAEEEEGRRHPRPQRVLVAPSPDPAAAAAAAEKLAKRARRCLQCDAAETPQWRSGPMGRGTLCNACGVWYGRALPEHRPAARPIADLTPDNPIWEPAVPGAIYLVRKTAKQRRPPPRTEAAPAPPPPPRPATSCLHCGSPEPPIWREGPMGRREVCTACGARYKKGRPLPECRPMASPVTDSPPESPVWETQVPPPRAVYLARKPAKRGRLAKQGKPPSKKRRSCLHCGSSETPQWREGPQGRGTLCNACGVRYKQGRLLPEYRPIASPTFVPSEHANTHRRVLQLHRQRQGKDQHAPPPPPPLHTGSAIDLPPVHDDHPTAAPGNADKHQVAAPCCTDEQPGGGKEHHVDGAPSSLDSLLLDGPSAPLIKESDEFVIS